MDCGPKELEGSDPLHLHPINGERRDGAGGFF